MKDLKLLTDKTVLRLIRMNLRIQKANSPDTYVATKAREENRDLFSEAARRGLNSNEVQS